MKPADLRGLYERMRSTRVFHVPMNIDLIRRPSSRDLVVRASGGQIFRIVSGLVNGTTGFAGRKDVDCKCGQINSRVIFRIASANANVRPRGIKHIFRHFTGLGGRTRNAKLKLSVYGSVIRQLNKGVAIGSRFKMKAAFGFALPCGVVGGIASAARNVRSSLSSRSSRLSRSSRPSSLARRPSGRAPRRRVPRGRTYVLVTRSASDGCSLLGTVLNGGCQLIRTRSNVRTIVVCSRIGPSLVLVSVGVPGLSKLRTAGVVHRLSTAIPVIIRDTCTCPRSRGTTGRTKYDSFVSGPVIRSRLGGVLGG